MRLRGNSRLSARHSLARCALQPTHVRRSTCAAQHTRSSVRATAAINHGHASRLHDNPRPTDWHPPRALKEARAPRPGATSMTCSRGRHKRESTASRVEMWADRVAPRTPNATSPAVAEPVYAKQMRRPNRRRKRPIARPPNPVPLLRRTGDALIHSAALMFAPMPAAQWCPPSGEWNASDRSAMPRCANSCLTIYSRTTMPTPVEVFSRRFVRTSAMRAPYGVQQAQRTGLSATQGESMLVEPGRPTAAIAHAARFHRNPNIGERIAA